MRSAEFECREILRATTGELFSGRHDARFTGISTDSRKVATGELFIALTGETFDGHDFLMDALRKGAAGLVIAGREIHRLDPLVGATVIAVKDPLTALGDIAHHRRMRFSAPVLAITGSCGKTTTKEMTAAILGQERSVLKNEGNFNNLIGLPLSLLRQNETHEVVILEMGTNRPGEIARLTEIAAPSLGVITNIGSAHLEGLKTLEAVREEKGSLFRGLAADGLAVVNRDDPVIVALAARRSGPTVTYAVDCEADVRAERLAYEGAGRLRFDLVIEGKADAVVMTTPGLHNVYNALASAAASWRLGMAPDAIRRGLELFRPVAGRQEITALKNGAHLINDAYNANPESVEAALGTLSALKGRGAATVILGDMLELGQQAEALHEKIGARVAAMGVDRLFLRGVFANCVAAGAEKDGLSKDRIFVMEDNEAIAAAVGAFLKRGDWVLVKGSRRMKMEEVVERLIRAFGRTDIDH